MGRSLQTLAPRRARGAVAAAVGLATLLVVPAVPDRIVTTPDGRLLRRVGSANQPLRGEAVTRFVLARALR